MPSSNSDKTVFYNIIRRNIDNLTSQMPLISPFKDVISNYVIKYLDPYVNAFLSGGTLDINEASEFAAAEAQDRIAKFRRAYLKEKEQQHEDQTNI